MPVPDKPLTFRPTWADYNALKSEIERDSTPGSAIFLLADSTLLFWKEEGFNWLDRVKCELPTRELTIDGREPPVKASYVGALSNDEPKYYEVFVAAMAQIGITDCMMIHKNPSKRERAHLEQSDLVLIGGGSIKNEWLSLEHTYLGESIKWRFYEGAVLIGIAEGASVLGNKTWYKLDPADSDYFVFKGLDLIPLSIQCNDTQSDELIAVANQVRAGFVGMGIPSGGALIFNTDAAFEAVRKFITEVKFNWEKNQAQVAYVAPPERGAGILVARERLRRREEKHPRVVPTPEDLAAAASEDAEDESDEVDINEEAKREAERLRLQGNEAFKEGDFKTSLRCYQSALRCDQYDPALYCNAAACCIKLKRPHDAVLACNAALRYSRGDNAKAWYRRGLAHLDIGDAVNAHYDFREALQRDPDDKAVEKQKDLTADKLRADERQKEREFADLIRAAGPFSTIDLSARKINAHEAKLLSWALQGNDTVQELNLPGCYVRPFGGEVLGAFLKSNDRLTSLDLTGNALRDQGILGLCDGLLHNTMLVNLKLANNNISDRSMSAFTEMLRDNTSLRDIDLSHNQLSFESVALFAACLKKNLSLEHLSLAGNRLGPESVWRMASVCIGHESMRRLDLRGFRLNASALAQLAERTKYKRCEILVGPLDVEVKPASEAGEQVVPLF
eukprot:TRINITY_DN8098_c0_g1_i1.p1 TRINITY_DN8098_c0_g1~~TRINITY_DN8098_c0_g1_i1.p1  ORF type:complete len:677 (-),score=127.92 TRINITY_DN8098_c0_g1_i1:9-2039(-)